MAAQLRLDLGPLPGVLPWQWDGLAARLDAAEPPGDNPDLADTDAADRWLAARRRRMLAAFDHFRAIGLIPRLAS